MTTASFSHTAGPTAIPVSDIRPWAVVGGLLLLLALLLLTLLLLLPSLLLFLGELGDDDRKVVLNHIQRRALRVVNCRGDSTEDAGKFTGCHTLGIV